MRSHRHIPPNRSSSWSPPAHAAAFLENVFAEVYKSAGWQDYMARNLMEPAYMNGADYGRYLAARQPEFTRFIADVGLAGKK